MNTSACGDIIDCTEFVWGMYTDINVSCVHEVIGYVGYLCERTNDWCSVGCKELLFTAFKCQDNWIFRSSISKKYSRKAVFTNHKVSSSPKSI